MIDPKHPTLSITRQFELIRLNRSTWYYETAPENAEDFALKKLIDRIFTDMPYFGSRKMAEMLRRAGHPAGRKRVQRLMREMGLEVIWQRPSSRWTANVISMFIGAINSTRRAPTAISSAWLDQRPLPIRQRICTMQPGTAILPPGGLRPHFVTPLEIRQPKRITKAGTTPLFVYLTEFRVRLL